MTEDYRATEGMWAEIEESVSHHHGPITWPPLLELRSRIQALETRIESVNLEERLQRDFKFLFDRIEALANDQIRQDLMTANTPAPSQAAETTPVRAENAQTQDSPAGTTTGCDHLWLDYTVIPDWRSRREGGPERDETGHVMLQQCARSKCLALQLGRKIPVA